MTLTDNQKTAIVISISISVILILAILIYYEKLPFQQTSQQTSLVLDTSVHTSTPSVLVQPLPQPIPQPIPQPLPQPIPQPIQTGAVAPVVPVVTKIKFMREVYVRNEIGVDQDRFKSTLHGDASLDSVNQCVQLNVPLKFSEGIILYNGVVLNDFEAEFAMKFNGESSNITNLYFFWDCLEIPKNSRPQQQGNQIIIHRNPDLYGVYSGDNAQNERLFQQPLHVSQDWMKVKIMCYLNVVTTIIYRSATDNTVFETKLKNKIPTGSFFGIGCESMSGGPICQVKYINISKLILESPLPTTTVSPVQSMTGSYDNPY